MIKLLASIVTLLTLLVSSQAALADRRVALVVGNSHYKDANLTLSNPSNDAEDVSNTLQKLGFEVVRVTDASKRDFDGALQKFARIAADADSALFFYAGHAMQYQGRNYLMPTDAELEDEISLRYQMVAMEDVRSALDRANGVKIMILDACRNNPLADRLLRKVNGQTRNMGATRGLARVDKTQGMVVAYATAADDVAMDGNARNSPFTTALIQRLQEPGLEVEMMFRRIASDVNASTEGRQRPETYISLLSEYYLNQTDRLAWDRVKDSGDPAALRGFIARFPSSVRVLDAKYKLEILERSAAERLDRARIEREKADREAAQRREAEDLRAKLAEIDSVSDPTERQRLKNEAEKLRMAARERQATEAARQQILEICKRESEELRALTVAGNKADIEGLRNRAECPSIVASIDQALTSIKQAAADRECQRDRGALALLDVKDVTGLRALAERSPCEEVRNTASARLLRVEVETHAQDQACKTDQERFAALQAAGVGGREDMERFARDLTCERLRPVVLASLGKAGAAPGAGAGAPAALPANTPILVSAAQSELRRLGCYPAADRSAADGRLSPVTRDAIQRYFKQRGQKVAKVEVTEAMVSELKEIDGRFCPLICGRGETASGEQCIAAPHKGTSKPTPVARRTNEDPRPQRSLPPRETASRPAARPFLARPAPRQAAQPVARAEARPAPAAAPAASRPAIGIGF